MEQTPSPSPAELPETPRTRVRRHAERGSHELDLVRAILDEALLCHVAVGLPDGPRVLPTAHVRVGDSVYVHGARANHLFGVLASGVPACLTVTLLDGLVFSRIAFHHSMNYRSVVLFGAGTEVTDPGEKRAALGALVEHLARGRSAEARAPNDAELRATLVVRFPITEGSAKVRTGPPLDAPEHAENGCWAGVLPLRLSAGPPVPDALVSPAPPPSVAVTERARALGLGARTPYESRVGELVVSTDPSRIQFERVHRFLAEDAYWAKGVSEAANRRAFESSLCFGVYRGVEQLAFARVVTDFARFAYLADVFTVERERGRGLSRLLLEHVFAHPDLAGIGRWLLGTADAHPLYEKFGFVRAPSGRYMVRDPAAAAPPLEAVAGAG